MIEIKHLCKNYKEKVVYQDFNITFKEQEISVLMGPSGSGKTTLLRILAGLEPYDCGQILGLADKKVAFVFQENRLMPWLTVRENIEYVLDDAASEKMKKGKVDQVIEKMQLTSVAHELIPTLSGGMKRRVALGRAFAYEGDLMLLDEPFKGLDDSLKTNIIEELLTYWHKQKPTIICVTHDLEEAKRLGLVIEIGKAGQHGND